MVKNKTPKTLVDWTGVSTNCGVEVGKGQIKHIWIPTHSYLIPALQVKVKRSLIIYSLLHLSCTTSISGLIKQIKCSSKNAMRHYCYRPAPHYILDTLMGTFVSLLTKISLEHPAQLCRMSAKHQQPVCATCKVSNVKKNLWSNDLENKVKVKFFICHKRSRHYASRLQISSLYRKLLLTYWNLSIPL